MRALCLLLLAVPLTLHAADRTWDGGGDGASWSDAANWSDDALPGPADRALIGGSAAVRITQGVSIMRLELSGTATLTLESTLNLGAGGGGVGAGATLAFAGSSIYLTTDGPLVVEGRLEWGSYGQVVSNGGTGTLVVAPGGRVRLFAGADKRVGVDVRNEGTLRWEDGPFYLLGRTLDNAGLFEIALAADQNFSLYAGDPAVRNTGTVRKSGAATATFYGKLQSVGGRVDVEAGALALEAGSRWENATVAVAAGATLRLGRSTLQEPHLFAGTTAGAPAGTFVVDGNYAYLAADTTGGTLDVGGTGVQIGYAQLGTEGATPPRPAPTNRGLMRFVGAEKQIRGAFVNSGTVRWEAGRIVFGRGYPFTNAGLFEIALAAETEFAGSGEAGPFVNTGTIRQTAAVKATFTSVELRTVEGVVDVQAGALVHNGAATRWDDATVAVARGALLHLAASGRFNEVAGTLRGDIGGTFLVSGIGGYTTTLVADTVRGGTLDLRGAGLQVGDAHVGTLANPGRRPAPRNTGFVTFVEAYDLALEAPFTNAGYALWTGGTLRVRAGQTFTNAGLFEMRLARNATMEGRDGTFVNDGRIVKNGVGTATLEPFLRLPPGATLDVREGMVDQRNRSYTRRPTFTIAEGATFRYGGGAAGDLHVIADTLRLSPAGHFGAEGTVVGDSVLPAVLQVGGTGFGLWGRFPIRLDGVRLRNLGLIAINAGRVELDQDAVNHGTVRWEGGNQLFTTSFTNLGTFEVTGTASPWAYNGFFGTSFTNEGVFRQLAPGLPYATHFQNFGQLEIASTFSVGGNYPGSFSNAEAGEVTGTGTLDLTLAGTVVNAGRMAPGPGPHGAGVGTLTIAARGPIPLARLDVDLLGADSLGYDQLVLTGGGRFELGGALVVRPRSGVQVGDAFGVIRGAVAGAFGQITSTRPALGFVAAASPAGLRLTATEGQAGSTFAVLPDVLVSGGPREVTLTGNTFPAGAAVRLECRACLDPGGHGTVAGEIVAQAEGELRAHFDLAQDAIYGDYDVVVVPPGGAALRGAVTIVPVYAMPLFEPTGTQRVPVVPETSMDGVRWSEWRLFNVSNNPEPTFYVLRVVPPASRNVRVRLNTRVHGEGSDVWRRDTARNPDELFLLTQVNPGDAALVALGLGISPENVDFDAIALAKSEGAEAPPGSADTGEAFPESAGAAGCAPNATLAALPARQEGKDAWGAAQEFLVEQAQGMARSKIEDAVKEILLEGVCEKFSRYLFQTYPDDWNVQMNRAMDDVFNAMPRNATQQPNWILQEAARRLFPELEKFKEAADCGDKFGRAFMDRVRIKEKGIVDVYRQARRSGNQNLEDAYNEWAAARAFNEGKVLAGYNGFSSIHLTMRMERGDVVTTQPPCTPLPPIENRPQPRIGGAYDPNDKTTDSEFACRRGTVLVDGVATERCVRYAIPLARAGEALSYTVHFENKAQATGEAETVTIRDTLDAAFDPASLVVTGSSSDSTLAVTTSGQVVTFTFAGINLPPNRVPPEGEGYVSYTVRPAAPLPGGTTVRNRASIVFDFNPPIATPEVVHVVRQVADPAVSVVARDSAAVDRPYTSRWTVRNAGPDAAPGTRLTFTLPAGVALVGASSSAGSCAGTPLVCPFGTLAPGAVGTVELVVTPAAPGTLDILAQAETDVELAYPVNSRVRLRAAVAVGVGAEPGGGLPAALVLSPNRPNPFGATTRIRFGLPRPGPVRLALYDVLGREVLRVLDDERAAGWHEVTVDAGALAAGVYVYRLETGQAVKTRTLVVLR